MYLLSNMAILGSYVRFQEYIPWVASFLPSKSGHQEFYIL